MAFVDFQVQAGRIIRDRSGIGGMLQLRVRRHEKPGIHRSRERYRDDAAEQRQEQQWEDKIPQCAHSSQI